jgi:hypothetical protein
MNARTLSKRYPWYGKHFRAVNTLACFISMDVAEILQRLDSRMQSPGVVVRPDTAKRRAA